MDENMLTAEQPTKKEDLRATKARWVVLFFISVVSIGSYFCYDNPSALQTQLTDIFDINTFEYTILYSVYSLPNIILPLFGGFFIDKIGIRVGLLLFSSLVAVGQAIFAFGCSIEVYYVAVIGRFIFGLGGESLSVASSTITFQWFINKEMALAMGVTICVSRIGSVMNDFIEPEMYAATGSVVYGVWFGFLLCVIGIIAVLIVNCLDVRADRMQGITGKKTLDPSEQVNLRDIKTFGLVYWLLSIQCIVIYICVMVFNGIASNFFQKRFGFSTVEAGEFIAITFGIAAVITPFLGGAVDKYGKRTYLMLISSLFVLIPHIVLALLPDCDGCIEGVFMLIFLGIGYSIYASVIWAAIPLVITEKRAIGTAFGVITALQNFGLFFAPLVVGEIADTTSLKHGYFWVSIFFALCGLVGVSTSVWIHILDVRSGRTLNKCHQNAPEIRAASFRRSFADDDLLKDDYIFE